MFDNQNCLAENREKKTSFGVRPNKRLVSPDLNPIENLWGIVKKKKRLSSDELYLSHTQLYRV